jgi:hypothetical protein
LIGSISDTRVEARPPFGHLCGNGLGRITLEALRFHIGLYTLSASTSVRLQTDVVFTPWRLRRISKKVAFVRQMAEAGSRGFVRSEMNAGHNLDKSMTWHDGVNLHRSAAICRENCHPPVPTPRFERHQSALLIECVTYAHQSLYEALICQLYPKTR